MTGPSGGNWIERVLAVRRWQRGGERAPHKPLLLLYAIGRLQSIGASRVAFTDAEDRLGQLLDEFGPARASTPAYPFHHLQTDGLWVVSTDDGSDPGTSVGRLRASGAIGALNPDLEHALLSDPQLMARIVHAILDENFPESMHADLCALAQVDLVALDESAISLRVAALARTRRRDPAFRDAVLVAYEYRCALCGYDGRMGNEAVGLDAAHVRWWAFDGPDLIENALCLCTLHHKLFDRGAIGMTGGRDVAVSARFVGQSPTARTLVLDLVGAPVRPPQPGMPPVDDVHVAWHTDEVFRGPGRAVA